MLRMAEWLSFQEEWVVISEHFLFLPFLTGKGENDTGAIFAVCRTLKGILGTSSTEEL